MLSAVGRPVHARHPHAAEADRGAPPVRRRRAGDPAIALTRALLDRVEHASATDALVGRPTCGSPAAVTIVTSLRRRRSRCRAVRRRCRRSVEALRASFSRARATLALAVSAAKPTSVWPARRAPPSAASTSAVGSSSTVNAARRFAILPRAPRPAGSRRPRPHITRRLPRRTRARTSARARRRSASHELDVRGRAHRDVRPEHVDLRAAAAAASAIANPSVPTTGCRRSARCRSARACRRRSRARACPSAARGRRADRRRRRSRPAPASARRPARLPSRAPRSSGPRRTTPRSAAARRWRASRRATTCAGSSPVRRARAAGASAASVRTLSAMPCASFASVFGGRRAIRKTSAARGQREMAGRVVLGQRCPRKGAAQRVALELVAQHRRAAERGERRRPDEACAPGVWITRTAWPAPVARRTTRAPCRRRSPAHPEQQPGHGRAASGSGTSACRRRLPRARS